MHLRLTILSVIVLSSLLAGCGTTSGTTDEEEEDKKVSTLPWNKPQKWEKAGPVGGGGGSVGY